MVTSQSVRDPLARILDEDRAILPTEEDLRRSDELGMVRHVEEAICEHLGIPVIPVDLSTLGCDSAS